jgi:MFS family permease
MPAAAPASAPANPWSALQQRQFRAIWFALLASNIGTWFHTVGAAWQMTELSGNPAMVAAVQAMTTLPMFFFALPAGALADIVDRRKMLMVSEGALLICAALCAVAALAQVMTPGLLLALTFGLGVGAAFGTPAWQAIVPEVSGRENLSSAIALQGIGINLARAIGPAVAGAVVAAAGPGIAYGINALSFVFTVVTMARWRRAVEPSVLPPERFGAAIRTAVGYVRNSPEFIAILLRGACFIFPASALWALLPLVTKDLLNLPAWGLGAALGVVGIGALGCAALLPQLRQGWGERGSLLVFAGMYAAALLVAGLGSAAWITGPLITALILGLLAAGAGWMANMVILNSTAQGAIPAWVRARAMSVYVVVFLGGQALGSFAWGAVATGVGVGHAMLIAAGLQAALALVAWRLALPAGAPDRHDPTRHWPDPGSPARDLRQDPATMVVIHYQVPIKNEPEFRRLMGELRRQRLRDGAHRWSLFTHYDSAGRWTEVFEIESWTAHLRQHDRVNKTSAEIESSIQSLLIGSREVHHLLAEAPGRGTVPGENLANAEENVAQRDP